jgi:two-component system, response regulator PdtaR
MTSISNTSPLVLMVEDEALVRLSGVGILIDAGFRTIEAVNSVEALLILEADSNVQLLFTDVNMPGTIDGFALARQVYDRWPHIGIMIASGRSMPKPHQLPTGCRFYRKPYSPQTVVRHARELTAA